MKELCEPYISYLNRKAKPKYLTYLDFTGLFSILV